MTQTGNTPITLFHRQCNAGVCICVNMCTMKLYGGVKEERDSFGYLLTVDCSYAERRRLCVCVSIHMASGERWGMCAGYATLAPHHSSLPSCQPHPHGFIRKYITLMTACPVSNTTNHCVLERSDTRVLLNKHF